MQNQYYNNPGVGFVNNQGVSYNTVNRPIAPNPVSSQPVTIEEMNSMQSNAKTFDLKIDPIELTKAKCTHKHPVTGENMLRQNDDGSFTCGVCGATFNFFDGTAADVEKAVKTIIDMFQTAKTIYYDAPIDMTVAYYAMIPLLYKFPGLWDLACKNLAKYGNVNPSPTNPISSGYQGFSALNNLLTNPMGMQGYMQQPMMNQMGYMQQPMMNGYQQPMMNQMGYMQQPMMNGYQQPMMNQPDVNPMAYNAPVAPTPGVNPATAPAAPVAAPGVAPAPASGNEIQQQKVYNV